MKSDDIPKIIDQAEKLDENVLVIPFRFNTDFIKKFIKSSKLKVLDGYIELPSLINASSYMIYAAGMGLTIEAGVLGVPSIKIAGFHRKHSSVDLARELGIQVTEIQDISNSVDDLKAPKGDWLINNGKKSVSNVLDLIKDFDKIKSHPSGVSSCKKIWSARSEFR